MTPNIQLMQRMGIMSGQMRAQDYVHNASWFNKDGVKIGWGDLSQADLVNISERLTAEDKVFVVLSEHPGYWDLLDGVNETGTAAARLRSPGADYLRKNCRFVIFPGEVLRVSEHEGAERRDRNSFYTTVERSDPRIQGLFT